MQRLAGKRPFPGPSGRLLGYARVSTEDQATDAQTDELTASGCDVIFRETRSGVSRARPELARLMREIAAGDVVVVVRLDRLARSVSHLLETRGAHFRSLRDPIDTSTPQGIFSLQVLGAVAELERALISERTKAGIEAAKARGRRLGNPGLRERRPEALHKISAARDEVYVGTLLASLDTWLPTVRRMRPAHPWEDVVRVLNLKAARPWTAERLRSAVRRLVQERLAEPHLIERAGRKPAQDRLLTLIAGIATANPDLTLRDIAAQLEAMRESTPRGGQHWSASSVKHLLDQARGLGLVASTQPGGGDGETETCVSGWKFVWLLSQPQWIK